MKDMTLEDAKVNISRQVTKKSGKPFKSGSKINTVTNVIEVEVPYKNATIKRAAYKFAEDDSWVTVGMCKTVE